MIDAESQMEALRAHYQASLPNKRVSIELAWLALCADCSDSSRLESLMRLVHRLAGSAPSYGYREIGEIARSADALLEQFRRVDEPVSNPDECCGILDELTPLIDNLLQALEHASGTPEQTQVTH